MELIDLLDLKDVSIENLKNRFTEIAKLLFQEYQIKKGKEIYEFSEIEFYYYTKGHEDVITYPRTIDAGKWFFHSSGVDLSFKSDSKSYGGILIKSIKHGNETTDGPLKSSWILFDLFDAFEIKSDEYPLIVRKEKTKKNILTKKRNIKFNKDSDADNEKAKKKYKDDFQKFINFLDVEYLFYTKE